MDSLNVVSCMKMLSSSEMKYDSLEKSHLRYLSQIIFMGYAYKDDSRKEEKGTMIYLNARTNEWHTVNSTVCVIYGTCN